jgi:hypothetical protein
VEPGPSRTPGRDEKELEREGLRGNNKRIRQMLLKLFFSMIVGFIQLQNKQVTFYVPETDAMASSQ